MKTAKIVPLTQPSERSPELQGKRVLFLSPTSALSPLLQSQGIPHMRELSARFGVEFTLLTIEPADGELLSQEARQLREKLCAWGITWLTMPNGRVPLLPNSTSDLLRGIPKVARIIRSNKIDLVHCRSYVPAYIMLMLKKLAPTPFIFDMRGFYPDEYVRYGHWTREDWQYRCSKWLELRCIQAADWIILTSEGMHRELMAVIGESAGGAIDKKTSIIPNCVDMSRFIVDASTRDTMRTKYGLSNSIVFLWLVAGITKPHLPEEICSFVRVAQKRLGSSRLLVLTHTPGVEDILQGYGLTSQDYIIASVPPSEVPKYTAMADAGLNFCDSAHSGSAIKIAEYLASGVPLVISSTVERAEELTAEARTGVVVRSFSPQSYADAAVRIAGLLTDRVLVAKRCQGFAKERLSIDYAVNRYADVYRRVIQSS